MEQEGLVLDTRKYSLMRGILCWNTIIRGWTSLGTWHRGAVAETAGLRAPLHAAVGSHKAPRISASKARGRARKMKRSENALECRGEAQSAPGAKGKKHASTARDFLRSGERRKREEEGWPPPPWKKTSLHIPPVSIVLVKSLIYEEPSGEVQPNFPDKTSWIWLWYSTDVETVTFIIGTFGQFR